MQICNLHATWDPTLSTASGEALRSTKAGIPTRLGNNCYRLKCFPGSRNRESPVSPLRRGLNSPARPFGVRFAASERSGCDVLRTRAALRHATHRRSFPTSEVLSGRVPHTGSFFLPRPVPGVGTRGRAVPCPARKDLGLRHRARRLPPGVPAAPTRLSQLC